MQFRPAVNADRARDLLTTRLDTYAQHVSTSHTHRARRVRDPRDVESRVFGNYARVDTRVLFARLPIVRAQGMPIA